MRRTSPRLMLATLGLLLGCDGGGSFRDYSNYDLSQEYAECRDSNLSPGGAQRCSNIQKECDRRRKESGFRC